jgi:hypothetical protein
LSTVSECGTADWGDEALADSSRDVPLLHHVSGIALWSRFGNGSALLGQTGRFKPCPDGRAQTSPQVARHPGVHEHRYSQRTHQQQRLRDATCFSFMNGQTPGHDFIPEAAARVRSEAQHRAAVGIQIQQRACFGMRRAALQKVDLHGTDCPLGNRDQSLDGLRTDRSFGTPSDICRMAPSRFGSGSP